MRWSYPHWRALLLGLLVWASLLSACAAPPAPEPVSTSVPLVRPLVLWHAWSASEQRTLAMLIEQYNQTSAVPIVLQAVPAATFATELQDALLVGNAPDLLLVQSHTLGALSDTNLIQPITAAHWSPTEREDILPTVLASALVTGTLAMSATTAERPTDPAALLNDPAQLYGVPISFDTLGLYYHRAQAGTTPKSMAQVLAIAETLAQTDSEPPTWGMAYTLSLDKTLPYLSATGGAVFAPDGTVVLAASGRPGTEFWLEWLLALSRQPGVLATSDSIVIDSALRSQSAWMTIDWAHTLPRYQSLWGEQLEVAVLPPIEPEGLPPRPFVQSMVLALPEQAQPAPADQVAALIAYLHSPAVQTTLLEQGYQPVRASLPLTGGTSQLRAARSFRAQTATALPMPTSRFENEVVRGELQRMLAAVLRGVIAPSDAITRADQMIREQQQGLPAQP
ncbi:MAG: extracellular solute-binding protein [Chloroflexaceae bacterium]|nr:extracellular solute-binding protein [Chloroflexaceae bacterium]